VIWVGAPLLILLAIVFTLYDWRAGKAEEQAKAEAEVEAQQPSPFPVPPMDLVVPPSPRIAVSSVTNTRHEGEEAPGV
jgi:hypothetical protein